MLGERRAEVAVASLLLRQRYEKIGRYASFSAAFFAVQELIPIFADEIICIVLADGKKKGQKMDHVTTIPTQGQILVNIEDMSMLKDIKKAISMVKGVGKITIPRSKRLSSYERSLRDLDEGRVFEYDSLDDLIKEIEG